MSCNRAQLCGRLENRGAVRYSPAGVAMVKFSIAHRSEQPEAEAMRQVACRMPAVAMAEQAQQVARLPLGAQVKATGFLAPVGRNDPGLELHILNIELIE